MQPAAATVLWGYGDQQYTNVNIQAATDAMFITGDIGNTGDLQHNDRSRRINTARNARAARAFIESYADSSTNNHTGFSALTLTPQAGYAFIAGDFALDQLDSLTTPTGKVTFTTIDCGSWTLDIAQHGQNQYNFITDGTLITSLTISVPTTGLRVDLKQLSLDVAQVPLPGTLSLFAAGLALLGWLGGWQRKQRT